MADIPSKKLNIREAPASLFLSKKRPTLWQQNGILEKFPADLNIV
jgi:hypothetical protein